MRILPTFILGILLATNTQAETVFLLNNDATNGGTDPLASNEGDAGIGLTNGTDNDGLDLDEAGDSTVLTLSADDGGGDITFTTSAVSGNNNLFMDEDSMGHGNDRWGNSQNWTFSLDQDISFDALTFIVMDENDFVVQSVAWGSDSIDDTGQEWSFSTSGGIGTFSLLGFANGAGTYDFTDAGASTVPAGTAITLGFLGSANGGEQLSSLTITPRVVPEPSVFGLLAGCFAMIWIMVRRR